MAIMIIEHFINAGLGRVLVVAHHTNIIKTNFLERLNDIKPNFTFSDTDTTADCFVAIRSKSLDIDCSQFNLIVVDEAHQNYFASTIQRVVSNIQHQVLLTATPSKFVRAGGFDILPIARLDIPNKYFATLNFRVINAETSTTTDQYNDDNNLKTAVKFHRTEVKSMCDAVIPHLDDNKKLFICKDSKQAQLTAQYLTSVGITSYVSDHISDPDSVNANRFKSGDITSLVVCDRMRVGYSDNNLYHTIDMSFTHNPDVIMQILSRSNRGVQSQTKSYIKVTNNALNVRTRFMLSVAISLFRADNLLAYDGVSVANLNVPVTKNATVTTRANQSGASDNWFIPDNIDIIDFFSACDFIDGDTILRSLNNRIDYDYCLQVAKNYTSWSDICNNESSVRVYLINNNLRDQFISDTGFAAPREKSAGHKYADLNKSIVMSLASKFEYLYEFKSAHRTALKYATDNNFVNDLIGSTGNFLLAPVKKCECCGTEFRNKRAHSVYCSTDCKKAVRYERVKLARAEQKAEFGKRKY
jgi:hypothetical protein